MNGLEGESTALLGAGAVRELAARLDLKPTKQRGQNFVIDANTIRRIVQLSGVGPDDVVIEVGPGLGSLTLGLLEVGAEVTAIEIDDRLARQLPDTIAARMPSAAERLRVVESDAMQVRDLPGPAPTALVANLPYNVSVPVLLHLLERLQTWRTGLVMVQLEVCDRLVAAPGSKVYGVPSAKLAWYASAQRVGTVPPKVFWPVPNVDSGLVRINLREPPATRATREQVFEVIDAAFAQRRKMMRAALAGLCGGSAAASEVIERAGYDPQARGETLDINAFAAIAEALHHPHRPGTLGELG